LLQEPDLMNSLVIPVAVELLIFIIKALVVTLFAGFFVKRYLAPLVKKDQKTAEPRVPAGENKEISEEETKDKKEN
jgi:hypothetical protein